LCKIIFFTCKIESIKANDKTAISDPAREIIRRQFKDKFVEILRSLEATLADRESNPEKLE
jgi:hypothetical protein